MDDEKTINVDVLDKGGKLLPVGKADASLLRKAADYHVDLNDLEKVLPDNVQKDTKTKEKQNNNNLVWKELDVKLADIANLVFDSANYPVFIVQDDSLVYINRTAQKIINPDQDNNILGMRFLNLVCKDDWDKLAENIGEMLTNHKSVKCKFNTVASGFAELNLRAIYLPDIEHFSFILLGEEKIKTPKSKQDNSSFYDEDTGLPSFFLFEDRVQMAVLSASPTEREDKGKSVAVLGINIDNINDFNQLNLTEVVIKRIADNLAFNLPKRYTVARGLKYHFWILLNEIKDDFDLDFNIRRIKEVLDEGVKDNFVRHSIRYSIGCSIFPKNAHSAKELIEQTVSSVRQAITDAKTDAVVIYK